ncbi:MAG: hypothetical protein WDM91_12285 [Rhizomicrobium sp.]
MHEAGWVDVWHLALGVVGRQSPFVAIMIAAGAVFFLVMAVEGVRTSLLAIWHDHRAAPAHAPPKEAPVALAAPAPVMPSRNFSAPRVPRAAVLPARKRKPLTVSARQFRSPRPKIRRYPALEFPAAPEMPLYTADPAVLAPEGV